MMSLVSIRKLRFKVLSGVKDKPPCTLREWQSTAKHALEMIKSSKARTCKLVESTPSTTSQVAARTKGAWRTITPWITSRSSRGDRWRLLGLYGHKLSRAASQRSRQRVTLALSAFTSTHREVINLHSIWKETFRRSKRCCWTRLDHVPYSIHTWIALQQELEDPWLGFDLK